MSRVFLALLVISTSIFANNSYLIGSGIYDVTGPGADMQMMGYVDLQQKTEGISTRLYSRAFVVVDPTTGNRIAMVTIDICHVYESITQKVVEKLKGRFGSLYDEKNILIQATHTHSAPGGLSYYRMYNLPSLGFSPQNFEIVTEGVFQSIVRAHENLAPGKIAFNRGRLDGISINRSLEAYKRNPLVERLSYMDDVDRDMTVLGFRKDSGREIGAINWFAVHATSVKVANRLISSDNKGYASWRFERKKGANAFHQETFVASFPNSDAGDASPNTAKDIDGDKVWDCPLLDGDECAKHVGEKQAVKALALYETRGETLSGPVDFRHVFVDMSQVHIRPEFAGGKEAETCFSGIGLSMLAGTKDGVGIGKEGQSCASGDNKAKILCRRYPCHGEKPVVISSGLKTPFPWSPAILPVQILRIGQIALIGLPGEFTTMAGRRMKNTVLGVLKKQGVKYAILAGYANGYAGYVTTREEYAEQNYEGATTHFGEWTLAAYQQVAKDLSVAMVDGVANPPGQKPLDLEDEERRIVPKPRDFDALPEGKEIGQVESEVWGAYRKGDTVSFQYWGGYPNNNMLTQSSFLEIQKRADSGWSTVAYDRDPETKYIWTDKGKKTNLLTIEWKIPTDTASGEYRVLYRGYFKEKSGELSPYLGYSKIFSVGN